MDFLSASTSENIGKRAAAALVTGAVCGVAFAPALVLSFGLESTLAF